jgi:hypothetical protein
MVSTNAERLTLNAISALNKTADGPVIRFFHGIREKAGWKFPVAGMIMKALTAKPLPFARIITAIALFNVFFDVRTFFTYFIIGGHNKSLLILKSWYLQTLFAFS